MRKRSAKAEGPRISRQIRGLTPRRVPESYPHAVQGRCLASFVLGPPFRGWGVRRAVEFLECGVQTHGNVPVWEHYFSSAAMLKR
jgi:hypothetical protein